MPPPAAVAVRATCDVAGPAAAPALVLLHGSVVSRVMWTPQLRTLSSRYRVIAPDLPGHGSRAQEPFTFASATDTVESVVREIAGGPAIVAGLSLGGYVAIEFAHRHPELLRGLVLSGCSVKVGGPLAWYLAAVAALMRRGWLRASPASLERRTRRLFPPTLADVADLQVAAGLCPLPLAAAFTAMARRDFAALLDGFPRPLLILNGSRDRLPVRHAAAFAAGAPLRRVEQIEDAGHACNLDQAERYNDALIRFIEWLGSSSE